jgi:type III restriction enzyme
MMKKRLLLARRLLKADGVLIVTIDENEIYHLGMLLEQIFDNYLRHSVTVVINPKGTGESHLYCDKDGSFYSDLNGWEKPVLEELMKEKGFVGWLRNLPRRDWALCVPYELAGAKPFYPDFIIVRKKGRDFEVDIFEPHDDSRTDTWAKAKGLATFADSHGIEFGRLLIARKKGDQFQFADMNDRATRDKARKMQSPNDLESLFA